MTTSVMTPASCAVMALAQRLRAQGVQRMRLRPDLFTAFLSDMTDGKLTARGWVMSVHTPDGMMQIQARKCGVPIGE